MLRFIGLPQDFFLFIWLFLKSITGEIIGLLSFVSSLKITAWYKMSQIKGLCISLPTSSVKFNSHWGDIWKLPLGKGKQAPLSWGGCQLTFTQTHTDTQTPYTCFIWEHSKKLAVHELKWVLTNTEMLGAFILDFQPPRLWEIKLLVNKSPGTWLNESVFVLVQID